MPEPLSDRLTVTKVSRIKSPHFLCEFNLLVGQVDSSNQRFPSTILQGRYGSPGTMTEGGTHINSHHNVAAT